MQAEHSKVNVLSLAPGVTYALCGHLKPPKPQGPTMWTTLLFTMTLLSPYLDLTNILPFLPPPNTDAPVSAGSSPLSSTKGWSVRSHPVPVVPPASLSPPLPLPLPPGAGLLLPFPQSDPYVISQFGHAVSWCFWSLDSKCSLFPLSLSFLSRSTPPPLMAQFTVDPSRCLWLKSPPYLQ